jgi:hypothetical protein
MGLKITDQLDTDKGRTSEAYVNIKKTVFTKASSKSGHDSMCIEINLYVNETARLNEPQDTCRSAKIFKYFGFLDEGSPGLLQGLGGTDNAYAFAYSLLRDKLTELGHTVIDVD